MSRRGHTKNQDKRSKNGDGKVGAGKAPEMNATNGANGTKRWRLSPADAHEWVSFEDPTEARTWRFDVTFLLSHWECIYGNGCQGVLTAPAPELAQGCCSYGAHMTGDEDVARVKAAAKTLTDDQWQFAEQGRRGGVARRGTTGVTVTRLVEDACIFLNRPGFPGGPGCALHRAALERGEKPMDLKPDVCWQLPLRREDTVHPDASVTSVVGEWDRVHWGQGGEEFAWWCTEAPEAFRGGTPVWRQMQDELCAMVGPAVFALLAPYLEVREASGALLPHPTVRQRG
jgi:hypothetical protein